MLYRVQVVFEIVIDSKRKVDLLSTNDWSLLIMVEDRSKLILDGNLNRPGEESYHPTITLLEEIEEP